MDGYEGDLKSTWDKAHYPFRVGVYTYIFEERKRCQGGNRVSKPPDGVEFYTDFLLKRAQEKNVSEADLGKELIDAILGGVDTTSVSLSTTLLFLAMYPEVQEKAYLEQISIFDDSEQDPSVEDMNSMHYLKMVIKETLRLISPPGVVRTCEGNVKIGTYTLPKGAILYISHYKVHRDPRYWERPNSFYPEHFLPEKEAVRHKYAYIPFGWGPRMCSGFQYSNYVSLIVLSMLLRNFKLTTTIKHEDIIYDYNVMLTMRSGYPIYFESR